MAKFPMPVGTPTYFEGDILGKINNIKITDFLKDIPFGIFEAEITAPENCNIPILQLRFKIGQGTRTISPLGKWTSWYFSEELENSLEFGYKFKILRGYVFEKKSP